MLPRSGTGDRPPAASESSAGRRNQQLAFWGILLLGCLLRLYKLGEQSLWIDEVFQIIDASRPVETFIEPFLNLNLGATQKSPLSFALHHGWLQIGGGEFFLRLPSVLFSVLEVGVLFHLARALLGWRTGALAAFLLALSPLHIWYAQELRYYSLWTLLTTCAFLALVMAWKRGRLRAWIAYVGSTILSGMAFVVGVLILPLHWLSGALLWRAPHTSRTFRLRFAGLQGLAFLAIAAPMATRALRQGVESVGTPRGPELMALPYTFYTFVAGYSAGPSLRELHLSPGAREILLGHPEVLLFLAVFAPLIVMGAWRLVRYTPAREFLLPWAFGLPVLVFGIALLLGLTFNVRYALPALTAFTVVLAVGIQAIASVRWRAAAVAVVLLCLSFSLAHHYFDPEYHKADVRSAVEHVRTADPDEPVVAVTGQVMVAVGHYGRGELRPIELRSCQPEVSDTVTIARWVSRSKVYRSEPAPKAAFEDMPHLWLLSGRDWRQRAGECLDWLERTHRIAERQEFPGIELYRLVRRPRESAR